MNSKALFARFLKEHNVYLEWQYNMLHFKFENIPFSTLFDIHAKSLIDEFDWSKTTKPYEWSRLNTCWHSLLNEINKKT